MGSLVESTNPEYCLVGVAPVQPGSDVIRSADGAEGGGEEARRDHRRVHEYAIRGLARATAVEETAVMRAVSLARRRWRRRRR